MTSAQVLSGIGFLLIAWGTGCAALALWRDMTVHGRWSVAQRRFNGLLDWLRRRRARLIFWRRPAPITLNVHSAHHGQGSGHLTLTATAEGEAIPSDETIEQAVARLLTRTDRLQQKLAEHDQKHREDVDALRAEIGGLNERVRLADEAVKKHAEELALGTVPLQMSGLFLVGLGTLLAALPAMLGW